MSSVNRNKIRKLILKEFKMLGMQPMQSMGKIGAFSQNSQGCDACGMSPCGCDEYNEMGEDALMPQHSMQQPMDHSQKGNVSREDFNKRITAFRIEVRSTYDSTSRIILISFR